MERRTEEFEISEQTVVEAGPEDLIRKIKGAKCGKVVAEE